MLDSVGTNGVITSPCVYSILRYTFDVEYESVVRVITRIPRRRMECEDRREQRERVREDDADGRTNERKDCHDSRTTKCYVEVRNASSLVGSKQG